ncbi:methyltransferase TRM13-domain-containing protein [Radiomyces spectabilis]|uniref:methyltransferase TRM13-domain-containing protein n=1 Tax=Radiomyces spectabilis TaxID=64574 RepID=UPI00221E42A9|nr:methyltransferase TRM13-domain-containing protein [Radiomyces spectabilis]KAI8381175.1 methyltransferase TRM13-domain-containing protein [Radiomyces spectabilis]
MPKEPHAKPSEVGRKAKAAKAPPPPPPNRPQQCHFYVARKHRYCSLPAKRTNKYCGEHLIEQQKDGTDEISNKRIPCPYDPSHTIFEKDLDNHLKTRCNSRPKPPEEHYAVNVNCTLPLSQEELEFQKTLNLHKVMKTQPWIARIRLAELPKQELDELIVKVQKAYTDHVPTIEKDVQTHEATMDRRQAVQITKHIDQQSSLLGHMKLAGMLDDKKACFIEFGAGELSNYLKAAVAEENGEATYVLVDRKNVRGKYDPALLGRGTNPSTVQRIQIDIKDLDLSKVKSLLDSDGRKKKMVALSKHLCGSATDITLKCLMNYVDHERATGNNPQPISGIIIALCCHQLCRIEMYPNTEYLKQIGLNKLDFDRMCKMSSWAICGRPAEAQEDEHSEMTQEAADADLTSGHYSGRDHVEREKIGYQCKRVLDAGRLEFLQQHGFETRLVYYVDPETSLENCALIAVPQQ